MANRTLVRSTASVPHRDQDTRCSSGRQLPQQQAAKMMSCIIGSATPRSDATEDGARASPERRGDQPATAQPMPKGGGGKAQLRPASLHLAHSPLSPCTLDPALRRPSRANSDSCAPSQRLSDPHSTRSTNSTRLHVRSCSWPWLKRKSNLALAARGHEEGAPRKQLPSSLKISSTPRHPVHASSSSSSSSSVSGQQHLLPRRRNSAQLPAQPAAPPAAAAAAASAALEKLRDHPLADAALHQHQQQQQQQQQQSLPRSKTSTSPLRSALPASPSSSNPRPATQQLLVRSISTYLPAARLLPPPQHPNRKTLVLDLDHTLIMCATLEYPGKPDFIYTDTLGCRAKVWKRPYLMEFLREVRKRFEVVLFTAASQRHADAVMAVLDPYGLLVEHRLYVQHTVPTPQWQWVKDLSRLGRNLSQTLIVDDCEAAVLFQRQNWISIKPFRQVQAPIRDVALMEVLSFLTQKVLPSDDVRDVIAKHNQIAGAGSAGRAAAGPAAVKQRDVRPVVCARVVQPQPLQQQQQQQQPPPSLPQQQPPQQQQPSRQQQKQQQQSQQQPASPQGHTSCPPGKVMS